MMRSYSKSFQKLGRRLRNRFHSPIVEGKPSLPVYYKDDIPERDELLLEVYHEIERGIPWEQAVLRPEAAKHGERVAEYAFIAFCLSKITPFCMMDVGCVLNNPIIRDYVKKINQLSFLNPSAEKVCYDSYAYFKMPLDDWWGGHQFSLVTCLSTLEHIGFDNTRYGVCETDQGWDWPECIEAIVRSVETLLTMVEPGGQLLVSCPYGCREYVYHPPVTGVRTAQVLHFDHVKALMNAPFADRLTFRTLKLTQDGWESCRPEGQYESYGTIGPGASGLLFIMGRGA